ncbi:MAG: thioredoxin family protein [Anaerolineae bacterium]|jgi:small redox-active disulfide protein 2|nr:thioredoxin family protein [Anaerolineae bacterium]
MKVFVLGSGCAKCKRLEKMANEAMAELGINIKVEKVTDFEEIMKFDIMSTPALVINNTVMCSGRIPSSGELKEWFMTTSIEL